MIKEKIAKLINIKSIITLLTTVIFCVLSAIGKISADQFLMIFTTTIAFYFGTQVEKDTKAQ